MSLFTRTRPVAPDRRAITSLPWWPGGTNTDAGVAVNERTAMQLSAVWACVTLIADLIAQMPCAVYRVKDGVDVPVERDVPVISNPSMRGLARRDWVQQALVSVLLRGQAYGVVMASGDNGYPLAVEWAHPDWIEVWEPYPLQAPQYSMLGVPLTQYTAPLGNLVIMRGLTGPGWTKALNPIEFQASAIGVGLALQKFAAQWFGQGAHPSSILASDQRIDDEDANTIKERFQNAVRGREPVALGAGFKYQQIQVSPEESQFLQSREYSVNDIARIYRVPAELIGATPHGRGSLTYANRDQRIMDLLVLTIQYWLAKLEDCLSSLVPRGQFVKFDESALLRSDKLTRYQIHALGIQNQFETITEARLDEGKGPLPDKRLFPVDATAQAAPVPNPFAQPTAGGGGEDGPRSAPGPRLIPDYPPLDLEWSPAA